MTSGYTHCACAECFETVVSNDMAHPDLCDECVEAGCVQGSVTALIGAGGCCVDRDEAES